MVRQTVCLEWYRISKDGRCIKDKNYKVTVEPVKSPKPKRTRAPITATVCLEGYKISKDGRCIKDKNYQVLVKMTQQPIVTEVPEPLQIEYNVPYQQSIVPYHQSIGRFF